MHGQPEILPATGEKVLTHSDYEGTGAHALSLVRSFRSSRVVGALTGTATAGLGQTWSHNHAASLKQEGTAGSTARVLLGDGSIRAFNWDVATGRWKASNSIDTLTVNGAGLRYKRLADDSAWQFDLAGKLLTVTQRNGWVTTYTYGNASAPGQLTQVTNQFGRSLVFAYNAAGQLTSVSHPDGQTSSYSHDSAGRLSAVTQPGGAGGTVSKTYLYENAQFPQLLTGIIDETGNRLATYAYDSQGRGILTEHAGGADRHTIAYGASAGAPCNE
ncbi:DUF6531 domain-containing protein [Polaromonas sp. P1-6]|nr:DUF6531 domain-containing protein [Polaromonas sp. P1-6]